MKIVDEYTVLPQEGAAGFPGMLRLKQTWMFPQGGNRPLQVRGQIAHRGKLASAQYAELDFAAALFVRWLSLTTAWECAHATLR
jgi:hypothetical protein